MKKLSYIIVLIIICFNVFVGCSKKELEYGSAWFNFKTNEIEYFEKLPPENKLQEFIPQIEEVQNLYNLSIAMGMSPIDAMINVLTIYIDTLERLKVTSSV